MATNPKGDTGLDPVMEVLIAQLRRNGLLSGADITNMRRRLIEGGRRDLADGLAGVILSDMIDDPQARRASIHAIPDGCKDEG